MQSWASRQILDELSRTRKTDFNAFNVLLCHSCRNTSWFQPCDDFSMQHNAKQNWMHMTKRWNMTKRWCIWRRDDEEIMYLTEKWRRDDLSMNVEEMIHLWIGKKWSIWLQTVLVGFMSILQHSCPKQQDEIISDCRYYRLNLHSSCDVSYFHSMTKVHMMKWLLNSHQSQISYTEGICSHSLRLHAGGGEEIMRD